MRFFDCDEGSDQKLKEALEKSKSIRNVTVNDDAKTATFTFRGTYSQLKCLEAEMKKRRMPGALISHAFVSFKLQVPRGFRMAGFRSALGRLPGVKEITGVTKRDGEVIADLSSFDLQKLVSLAGTHEAKISVKTHELVRIEAKGEDVAKLKDALAGVEGVLRVKMDGDRIELLTVKSVSDGSIRRAAKKLKVEVGKIERVS
jgi:copper chaperone CopZ